VLPTWSRLRRCAADDLLPAMTLRFPILFVSRGSAASGLASLRPQPQNPHCPPNSLIAPGTENGSRSARQVLVGDHPTETNAASHRSALTVSLNRLEFHPAIETQAVTSSFWETLGEESDYSEINGNDDSDGVLWKRRVTAAFWKNKVFT